MGDRRTIVVVGGTPYWGAVSSQALRMSRAFRTLGHHVLYVECGGDAQPYREALRRYVQPCRGVVADPDCAGVWVTRSARVPGFPVSFPNVVRKWTCKRTSVRIERALRLLGDSEPFVIHYGWYFPELLRGSNIRARHVYECLDEHTAAPNIAAKPMAQCYIRRIEQRMLLRAEWTVYSNPALAESRCAAQSVVLPLGVDADHFGREPRMDPHEARGIGRPRIGFLGLVTVREDWAMVRRAAAARPDWQWVVLGPRRGVEAVGPSNLHWIGTVDYRDVPDWTQHWDTGMVPLALSDFNRGSWPLKFYEYFASGLPIASTPIPAASALRSETGGLVSVACDPSPEAFVEAVELVIGRKAELKPRAMAFARRHTWLARAERILALLSKAHSSDKVEHTRSL